ncbi:c-type cytochrome [Roseibium polysiphoniae]|uniref:Cytochrome c n=1 Tax=Roseibium polysiphoniae TaxID=2571221 RepID=A0ABR9CBT0_9HYPH|nr:cytochrome c [Roseibium polysiphoniae]MBD8877347.1 cytochrome c [Roseibium polysiphoniae]
MKIFRTHVLMVALSLAALPLLSTPGAAAERENGKVLALKWCSACHLVSKNQPVVNDAPLASFYELAAEDAISEATLKTFLADPHPQMPGMSLSNMEIADIARYIKTLEP